MKTGVGKCGVAVGLLVAQSLAVTGAMSAVAATPKAKMSSRPGSIQVLAGPAGTNSSEPRLSTLQDGSLLLSWLEGPREGSQRLLCSTLHNGTWSSPHTVAAGDSFFVNWADFPSVEPLGREGLVAHWLWRTGADTYAYEVRISVSADGGNTWSRSNRLHRDNSATEHGFVSLAPSAAGARAVWLDGHNFSDTTSHGEGAGPDMSLRTAEIASDGTISNERELDSRTCDCCQTAMVRTASGVLVAYRDRSLEEIRDISLVRYDAPRWSAPYSLARDHWKIAGCPVNGPAMVSRGNQLAIAWFTAAADSPRVLAAFSGDGGRTFSKAIPVDVRRPIGRVGVTLTTEGDALVSWLESGAGGDARIVVRQVRHDGTAGMVNDVASTASARGSGFPQIATIGDAVYFAWTETGVLPQVRMARATLRSLTR